MMKRMTTMISVVLLFSLLLSSCASAVPRAATETAVDEEEQSEALLSEADAPPEEVSFPPLEVSAPQTEPVKVKNTLFRAKFEGSTVAGSGEAVDGVYRFNATKTDGESWHIKLEANYPTVAGRDYRVTYRFHSDVAGKIKFGDFQEFEIQEGENSVTGILIADGGTSYLDLQLGMLPPFTLDFSEVEVEEYADEVDYEEALTSPVNFEKEKLVFEKHDQGYAPVLTRGRNAVSINYLATSWESGVWKSRLYVKTGLFPESGVRYHLAVDVTCDEDMPFEILFNDGEIEKGYGALYGQNVAAGEVTHCEAVITGTGAGEDLVMQFSLGEAPEGSTVKIGNLRIEKIRDHYTNMLPSTFALNEDIAIGTYKKLVPVAFSNIPLSSFSYSSTDSVFEGHDDGYLVRMNEAADSVTMDIYQAPAAASDRGVWKAKLYVDTGAALEAGQTYKVDFDLVPERNQGEYEVCFDSDSKENAYGALYGRSLTAGTADHISYIITPTESNGKLVLRLQLGKTDSAEGNKYTFRNLSIESLPVSYSDILPADFSYNTGANVFEAHDDGYTQSVSADGSSATLEITSAPSSDRGVWKSKLLIHTGVTPEPGTKYRISFDVTSEKNQNKYEVCFDGNRENAYGVLYERSLSPDSPDQISYTFTRAEAEINGPLVLRFQLGETNDESGNTITVRNLKIAKLTSEAGTSVLPDSFAYPSGNGTWKLKINSVPPTGAADYRSKLYIDTDAELDAGAQYQLTMSVTSSSSISNFGVVFSNTKTDEYPADRAYGDKWQGIGANETITINHSWTVGDISPRGLFIAFQLGNSPTGTVFTVNSVSLEKITSTPDQVTQLTIPAGFQRDTLSGMAGSETQSGGYTQTLTGSALTINAVPSDANPASSSLFVNTNTVLAPGKHKVIVSITTEQAVDFDLLFNHGSNERSFGEIQAQSLAAGETRDFEQEIISDTNTSTDPLIIQLHLGVSPEGNTVTVNSVTLEREVPERQETVTTRGGTVRGLVPVTLTASEAHADGYQQTLGSASFELWTDKGYSAALGGGGSSATVQFTNSPDSGHEVWRTKLFAETGAQLKAGKLYRISADVQATSELGYEICYNNGGTEKGVGVNYGLTASSTPQTVTYEVTPSTNANLIIQFSLGNAAAGNEVTVSNIKVEEVKGTPGENLMTDSLVAWAPIHRWAHEDYEASLSNTEDSATLAITKVPASGREAWKIKLFAETGAQLKAGSTYRVSVDVQAASKLGYEICYNNAEKEKDFGALYDLTASAGKETVTYTLTPEKDGVLTLQLNLGNAAAANEVTISGIRVEEVNFGAGTSVIPGFRYDSVGYIGKASDDGYVVSLEQHESSADFYIHHAPAERNPWNVKLNVHTGFTPVTGRGYRVTFDITAAKYQSLFEVFYDGKGEKDYGELYEKSLQAGKNTVSFIIPPTLSLGELSLQIRLGKTNGTDGNSYTISNITIDDAEFMSYTLPNVRAATELWTHADYTATLDKARDRATVRIEKTPAAGREAWKTKLFVHTGILLMEGKKYRISMDVKSIIPAPFEVCFNNGDKEKGLGAMYGLISTPSGQHVTYTTYPKEDTELVIQLSLGNCTPPNSIILSGLKVEKAGTMNLVSDTIYTF